VILRGEVGRLSSGGYAQKPIRNSPVPNANFWPYAPEDPRTISINSPTFADVQIDRYSLEVNWDISDALRLRSQSGYQYGKMSNGVDGDGSPLTGSYGNQVIHGNTFTQELNLVSQGDGRAQWVLGALYLSLSNPNTLRVYNNFIPPSVPAPPALQSVNVNSKSAGWGYAVFGQVTYDLSESLQLIAGARYNKDERSDNGGGTVTITLPFPVPPTVIPLNGSATSDAVTGKLGLNWKPTDSDLIYLTASRGYKPGGFNNNAAPFDPEFVWNYELGWKAEVSSHLRAQVAAFYMDYSGMQVNVFDPQTQTARVQNASSAKIMGAEAQATLRFGGFSLDASVGYVSSEVQGLSLVDTRFLPGGGNIPLGPPCTSPGTPPGCFNYAPFTVDLDGRQLAYAPDWTGSASMQYEFAIGNGTLTPRVQYSYMASQYSTLFQQPIADVVPSHNQTDFRLTYRNGEWMAEGYYTNAFDELYISGINGNLAFYGPPRQYGVRLSRTF
jgi:iron complex outermembrane receptor protein